MNTSCCSYARGMSHIWMSRISFAICLLLEALHAPGGVESLTLSWLVVFRKRALWLVSLLRKMTCNLRHPMGLRHCDLVSYTCMRTSHVLQSVAVCCSVLRCVAVCFSVLQWVAVHSRGCMYATCVNTSWHMWMRHVMYEWVMSLSLSRVFGMGWLRSVGSIKLQVSFAEYRLFYRALLQKRRII